MNARSVIIASCLLAACSSDDQDDTQVVDPVSRGEYIVNHVAVCIDCHTPRDPASGAPIPEMFMAGAECFAQLPNGSCLNTRNLTNHETGLLNRTDAEIKRMIADGIRPAATGDEALFPAMPYYVFHNMTEADLDAVVAYLRTIPGVDHAIPRSGPEFEVPAPANPLAEASIPMPMAGYADQAAALRGRYLAGNIGSCLDCHTPRGPNGVALERAFEGGLTFPRGMLRLPGGYPEIIYSANLTPDATGIQGYTVADVMRALKLDEDPNQDHQPLCPPMPAGPMDAFGGLTDADASDIGHYLLSLPPRRNVIPVDCSVPSTVAALAGALETPP